MAEKKKRRKSNIPKDETKEARFIRVVTPRVTKAVKAIRNVGHCAGPAYKYTSEQKKQIIEAIFVAVKDLDDKLEAKKAVEDVFNFA